jgi:UDP-glucose 4-epimerase
MSLKDSVRLVIHAYEHGQQGDIFVQKAPAATLDVLARALIRIFGRNSEIRIIGTRHGEKLFESLVSREEMAKADEDSEYYRIPADNRDLNYAKYFVEGETTVSSMEDYTSHNTVRLSEDATVELLLKLDYVQEQLHA